MSVSNSSMNVPGLLILVFCAGAGVALLWHFVVRAGQAKKAKSIHEKFQEQANTRKSAEETLRRTLAMFQLTHEVTASAAVALSFSEALQNALDIICTYTGWRIGHVLLPQWGQDNLCHLVANRSWHLEDTHNHESFLRHCEQQPLLTGQGLPGRAWESADVEWAHFQDIGEDTPFTQKLGMEVGLYFGLAVPIFHEDDLVAVLEFFSTPVIDPDSITLGALLGAGKQLGNAYERFRSQETMRDLNELLLQANEEKNQFLAVASHDLKNPLNTITLAAEAIYMPELDIEERERMLGVIINEARRAARLIQRLLDVSAIESGKFQFNPSVISLMESLLKVQTTLKEQARVKGQRIHLDLPEEDVYVFADADCLDQIMENLVSNALKFMPKGPPLKTVYLSCGVEDDKGWVEVRDEGPGFSEEDQAKAFGRFVRLGAQPTGGESSNGLGLSIVKKLMQAMNGSVALESRLGEGSTFRLSLPRYLEEERE